MNDAQHTQIAPDCKVSPLQTLLREVHIWLAQNVNAAIYTADEIHFRATRGEPDRRADLPPHWPSLILFDGDGVHFIDLTTAKGPMSPAQIAGNAVARQLAPLAVCSSVRQVEEACSAWGLLRRPALS